MIRLGSLVESSKTMARRRRLFDPDDPAPFPLSRSKVDLFLNCPRCFYLDRRLGIARPPGFPFNLNSAVDTLLKNEFDEYRQRAEPHPLMVENDVDAIPFIHDELDTWRNNFKGVRVLHEPSGFEVFGAIDDLWQDNSNGKLMVVDYKATSKNSEVSIDAPWQISYKRQIEFYQWLLRGRGLDISDRGYFVYCNGDRSQPRFDAQLRFKIKLIPYDGNAGWVEDTLTAARQLLEASKPPVLSAACEFCNYARQAHST
jgi:CRISPR/Cas system-associated exonuclease Cas4 (RecB family)